MIVRDRVSQRDRLARRRHRIRKKVSGTSDRPRLSVARTLKHVHVQIVDDTTSKTIAAVTTAAKTAQGKTKTEKAKWAGSAIAEAAKAKGIKAVIFDRGGRKYHGRVKAVADAAREAGLEF
ncbi:MAG: 50S ribosomal protein L18 [Candidatus Hydrogenedentota bacterium]